MYEEKKFVIDYKIIVIIVVVALVIAGTIYFFATRNNSVTENKEKKTTTKVVVKSNFDENFSIFYKTVINYYRNNDKLPEKINDQQTKTLKEFIDEKISDELKTEKNVLCDQDKSYGTIVKKSDTTYDVSIYLLCGKEDNEKTKTITIKNSVPTDDENKKKKIIVTEYEYKKATGEIRLVCPEGYDLNNDKCTKTVIDKIKATTTYNSNTKTTGAKLKNGSTYTTNTNPIINTSTKQTCPNGFSLSGSVCISNNPTYSEVYSPTYNPSCPSGFTLSYDRSNNPICSKKTTVSPTTINVKNYSCPSGYNSSGSGSNLKCYKTITTSSSYYCEDSNATLKGTTCYSTIKIAKYSCPSGYSLNSTYCTKKYNKSVDATQEEEFTYIWSTKTSMKGYTKTGNVREKEVDEIIKQEIKKEKEEVKKIEKEKSNSNTTLIIIIGLIVLGVICLIGYFVRIYIKNNTTKNKYIEK